jgi:acyl-CoA synthetase (AMP-forming)/AMP-acid ligase II
MLHQVADTYGDQEAIVRGSSRITFRALERESARVARGLLVAGVGKGSRVALLMPNSPDWVVAFMAITRIGAIAVPLSTLYQAPELRWVLRHADIDVLFIRDRYLNHDYVARLEEALPSLAQQDTTRLFLPEAPHLRAIYVWGDCDRTWAQRGPDSLLGAAERQPAIDREFLSQVEASITPADLLFMIYTSGSTADPKGVVHFHGNVIRHTYQMAHDFTLIEPGDRLASQRPYFWVAGLCATLLYTLHSGGCLIVPETDAPVEALRLIEAERLTFVGGAATWFTAIAAHAAAHQSEYTVAQLSLDIAGVARRTAAGDYAFVRESLEARIPFSATPLPQKRIPNMFGMTEMLGAHSAEPAPTVMPETKEGASGRAIPGVVRKVVDSASGRELPAGEVGELWVRGYSLMAGLYKKEREETFEPDGFYRTGDLCVVDEADCLTFKSRLGDMLKVHGANVAPLEVERCLNAQHGVFDSAVLGLPDGRGDTLVAAAVVPLEGVELDEQELIAQLRKELSSYKVPKRIAFLAAEAIPRTGSGKVQKFKLKPILEEALKA